MTPMQYQLPMTVKGMRWATREEIYDATSSEVGKNTGTADLFTRNYDYNSSSTIVLKVYDPSNTYKDFLIESFIERQYMVTTNVAKLYNFETIYRSATVNHLVFAKNVMISDNSNFPYTLLGAFKFIIILFGQYNIGSTVTVNGKKYRVYLSVSTNVFYGVEDE